MENFYEQIIKRKKTTADSWFSVLAIAAGIVVILIIATLAANHVPIISWLSLPLQLGAAYAAYIVSRTRNIEFEYCVINGDIDVDKITNKSRRKRIASVPSKSIAIIAPTGDSRLPSSEGKMVIDASSGEENAKTYTVVYENKGTRILIFEPKEEIVADLQKRNPRKVFVGE